MSYNHPKLDGCGYPFLEDYYSAKYPGHPFLEGYYLA